MKIALLSAYHGGSHKYWADGIREHSHHEITLFTLPARFWKWRMHGGAITLSREYLNATTDFDLILTTDMLDLSTFLALTRVKTSKTAVLLYMHENQLTYPLPMDVDQGPMRRQKGERDLHYSFINFSSMLSADQVIFNSQFHKDQLLNSLPSFLKRFPEFKEMETVTDIKKKSSIFPIGIKVPVQSDKPELPGSGSLPLIIWNQRWEFDKNPTLMLKILYELDARNVPFEAAICGQNFRKSPQEFNNALDVLGDRIIHFGYAEEDEYLRLLDRAEVTFSTAVHEFYGISVLEVVANKTYPLLPNRLCYPEVLPIEFHDQCLYEDENELVEKLIWALTNRDQARDAAIKLADATSGYLLPAIMPKFDELMEAAVRT